MAKKANKTSKKIRAAGREMKQNPPAVLAQTARKKGKAAAERQRKAILLSKARAKGGRVPRKRG